MVICSVVLEVAASNSENDCRRNNTHTKPSKRHDFLSLFAKLLW